MQAFKLIEKDLANGHREIAVQGELDLAVAGQLQEALARCKAEKVAIDLAECEFIDSTGIAVIVHASRMATEDGRKVVAHSASNQVLRVLDISGLLANGLVFGGLEEALSAPRASARS
jgi:anti-sigma B factor antagonist